MYIGEYEVYLGVNKVYIGKHKAHRRFIANEQPREDVRLRGGSLIEPCAIVPGAERISNRCNIEYNLRQK